MAEKCKRGQPAYPAAVQVAYGGSYYSAQEGCQAGKTRVCSIDFIVEKREIYEHISKASKIPHVIFVINECAD